PITSVLRLGPVAVVSPPSTKVDHTKSLDLSSRRPSEGEQVIWNSGQTSRWQAAASDDGTYDLGTDGKESLSFTAVYIDVDRFLELPLRVEGAAQLVAFLDGSEIARAAPKAKEKEDDEAPAAKLETKLSLTNGTHLLIIAAQSSAEGAPKLSLHVTPPQEKKNRARIELSARRSLRLSADDLLDRAVVSSSSLSADGSLLALRYRSPNITGSKRDAWLEFRRSDDGALLQTLRGDSAYSGFQWAPVGGRFSYVTRDGKKSTIWVTDVNGGSVQALRRGIENLTGHTWTPDAQSLILTIRTQGKKDSRGAQLLRGLPDRWSTYRDRTHLWQLSVASGSLRRLTGGELSTSLQDVHPQSGRLVYSTREMHYDKRPFSTSRLYELDLESLESKQLAEGVWLSGARYSPDANQLLVLGGPSAFGDIGTNVDEGQIANDYDTQAYLLNLNRPAKKLDVSAITREFGPSLSSGEWTHDGRIVFRATSTSRVRLYLYTPAAGTFRELDTPVEVVESFSTARATPAISYVGSSSNRPPVVYTSDLRSGDSRKIAEPAADRFDAIRLGEVKDWNFELKDGTEIQGRVYYPPDFDAKSKYPCIVYYYGGTSPTTRSFGGRYPKNLWAAHGYVVYVLQPSGAFGFGQKFSARHVNNWGKTVVPEIIDGVQKFLGAHKFVDPKRVGCIGASYGGFMTMLLISHTKMFSAAISHAGISSLSSYWGEGWWGYLYSSVATADSYPWNRKDLYLEQSALFRADQIDTPLLLLHGSADTNVPRGESEQMYSALKVLKKDVEYIRFEGEDHWILDYDKRRLWMETIIAWFDFKLKAEPQYWDKLYDGKG
ncbi:MAG: S9 family peptidase, partial [Planctomycetota bacterium]